MVALIRNKQTAALIAQFEDLSLVASVASAAQQRACVETLIDILGSEPAVAVSSGFRQLDQSRIFELLELGALESAVMLIIPPTAGFMVSRGDYDHFIVSVLLEGALMESSSAGCTYALAAVSALALAAVESEALCASRVSAVR